MYGVSTTDCEDYICHVIRNWWKVNMWNEMTPEFRLWCDTDTNCRHFLLFVYCLFRWRLPELSLPGWRPPALDGLPEEQGQEGGAVAYPDQRAATNPQPWLNPQSILQTVAVRDHMVHRDPLYGTDLRNFTTGISTNWGEKCIIIIAAMTRENRVRLQQHGGVPSLLINESFRRSSSINTVNWH